MSDATVYRGVLADRVPSIAGRTLVRDTLLCIGAAAFVGAAAQIVVPIPGTPVPVTGQTFAVLLSGAALGSVRGLIGMIIYLLVGMAGVPWFAAGAGSPTTGYLLGFVIAAYVVGSLSQYGGDRTVLRTLGTMTAGTALIYVFGVPWLMYAANLTLTEGLSAGVWPFLPGAALKILLAAGLLPATWKLVNRESQN